ncbi:hypothetical protein APTSU1_001427800 [Apodemus speciosus]|uniref:Uncharacterized protein n=1 Tax=Apodemus speciosus TaxID=105296 RepID=A0ABQ0FIG2_APOSI
MEDIHLNQTKGEIVASLTPLNGDLQPEKASVLVLNSEALDAGTK